MRTISSIQSASRITHDLPEPRVLVPTMGALHSGHLALIKRARRLVGKEGTLMVSIFVNPIQFGPSEDLAKYPRPRRNDLKLCRENGVDLVFAPEPAGMYLSRHSSFVDEETLSLGLCWESRPGHFRGVCTVVSKLFHILHPEFAVFGEKDFQQLAIIRRMVRDLNFPVGIIAVPTVREPDGLAMSSRNQYLDEKDRAAALSIRRALLAARQEVQDGQVQPARIISRIRDKLKKAGGQPDYISVFHPKTLEPLRNIDGPAVCAVAVKFGATRLIDNCRLR